MSATALAVLRIGTRRSALAMAQTRSVAAAIGTATGRGTELVPTVTEGDTSDRPLTDIGGTGVFVTGLRRRLLDGEVDLAVHSAKDLPTAPEPGLVIAAVPPREDPRDVLVARGRTLAELPIGARIGTGSPRRAAQLRALRPDLEIVPVRGNVDTRLRRVRDGELDGVVLARAGLLRLGRADEADEVFDPERMLPAPAQGALAVECRADDAETLAALHPIDDPASHAAVTAEHALLAALAAGCAAPVGALARVRSDAAFGDPAEDGIAIDLELTAAVVSITGDRVVRLSATGPADDAARIGRQLADAVLAAGAAELIGESR